MKNSNFSAPQQNNLDNLFQRLQISSTSNSFTKKKKHWKFDDTMHAQKDVRNLGMNNNPAVHPDFSGLQNYFTEPTGSGMSGYGGGMQDATSSRGVGGTGGGSEDTEGNMDANDLLGLNPYLSKNVTSFRDGGMFGEFARQYDNGGVVPQPQQQVMQQQVMQQPQEAMSQQQESYAKQATDMLALAQLEAFGKKFASQLPQGQLPQANNGMKMRKYTQGGRF